MAGVFIRSSHLKLKASIIISDNDLHLKTSCTSVVRMTIDQPARSHQVSM